jgi:hypothetical protein
VIRKGDIATALANALMRLGKNDWEGVLWAIDRAREVTVDYRAQGQARRMADRLIEEDGVEMTVRFGRQIEGRTLRETVHGNPGERRVLPAGTRVALRSADNLPEDSLTKWWAHPLEGHPWPLDTAAWARIGVGLCQGDVEVLDNE